MTTVPPYPWKLTVALFDDLVEATARSADLAAARKVLETYRETIEQGRELADQEDPWKVTVAFFDDFEAAVRSADLAAARKVLETYRESIEQNR